MSQRMHRVRARATHQPELPPAPTVPAGSPARPHSRVSSGSLFRFGFIGAIGVLLAVGLAEAVRVVGSELLLIVVAAFLAIGLEPLVGWLVRRGLRRGLAVALIAVVSVGLVAGFLTAAVPPLVAEGRQLVNAAPDYVQQLQDRHTTVGRLNSSLHLEQRLRQLASSQVSLNSLGGLLDLGRTVLSYSLQLLLVTVLTIYFLADFPGIKAAAYRLVPAPRRPGVAHIGDAIIARTGGYLLGNLLTSLVAIVAQFVVLRILDVPFALVLSVFVGVLDLVPLIGSTVAGVVVTLVVLAAVSAPAALVNVGFTIGYRLFEDYVLSPGILRRTVSVSPVVTVVAVLLGGALLGIEGALIAVPVAAAIQLIVTEVVYPRADRAGRAG